MASNLKAAKSSYFLLKTEPFEFSISDLKNSPAGISEWTGIRNAQAKTILCKAVPGDVCFIYHSSCGKDVGIAGTARVVREPYSDPTSFDVKSKYFDAREAAKFRPVIADADAKWKCVDVEYIDTWDPPVLLSSLKALVAAPDSCLGAALKNMQLFRFSRLSVQEVRLEEAQALFQLRDRGGVESAGPCLHRTPPPGGAKRAQTASSNSSSLGKTTKRRKSSPLKV